MRYRLLTALLLVAASCSSKDEPVPAAGTASYRRDGQLTTCTAKAALLPSLTGLLPYEILQLALTTTPQPAAGAEVLYVNFYRQPGSPITSFFLQGCTHVQNGSQYTVYDHGSYTLTATAGGGYSGTFAGTAAGPPTSTISGGVFTDTRP